jgi:hypothetical protein
MFFYFEFFSRIHTNHAADPNGSADPRLRTAAVCEWAFSRYFRTECECECELKISKTTHSPHQFS